MFEKHWMQPFEIVWIARSKNSAGERYINMIKLTKEKIILNSFKYSIDQIVIIRSYIMKESHSRKKLFFILSVGIVCAVQYLNAQQHGQHLKGIFFN